ncbi:MAG: AMP-binding protein [Chloroflexi bacterium]|nr:AMP-binding protein [Chloroflexota bacterium]
MMTLFQRLEANAARHPDKAAFIYFQNGDWTTITYAQLLDLSNRFISGLLAAHVTPNMRAALMTPPSVEFFALAFAMLKLGIVPIVIDPAIGLGNLSECFAESKPEIFIGNTLAHTLRIIFGWGKDSIKHNLTLSQLLTTYHLPLTTDHSSLITAPAAIIYTSGSTGIPKGAVYTEANLSAQMDMLAETFHISPDEIDLPAFPLYALIDVLLGVTSVIPDITFPVPGKTNPEKVINAIQKFNVTNMFASPVVLGILVDYVFARQSFPSLRGRSWFLPEAISLWVKRLLRRPNTKTAARNTCAVRQCRCDEKLHSLKRVITAGAPATIQLQEKFRKLLDDKTDLFGIYGATEALPIAKIESREIFEVKERSAQGAGVCLGKPVDGMKVRVIGISDSVIAQWQESLEVSPNVVGEITVQGAAVTESYIARGEANRLSKIKNGIEIIHRMGDVGYFDEQGRLWYCGRKAHRVVTKDDVLFTEQIEGIFNMHPLIYRTALVGVNGEPVLWIELAQKADKDKIKAELIELGKNHPQASKIKTFLFMKKFPTDVRHNSKIIREQLTLLAEKRFL